MKLGAFSVSLAVEDIEASKLSADEIDSPASGLGG